MGEVMTGMRWLALLCVVCTTLGCHTRRATLIAGGVASGVAIGSTYSIATSHGETPVLLTGTAITAGLFGLLALLSGLDHEEANERPRPIVIPAPDHRDEAWEYTKVAQVAARSGDCGAVLAYRRLVLKLDSDFHDVVFARDAAIARCLADPTAWPSALFPPSTAPTQRPQQPPPAPDTSETPDAPAPSRPLTPLP